MTAKSTTKIMTIRMYPTKITNHMYLWYFVRTKKYKKYPPSTLQSLLCGLNRILKKSKALSSTLDDVNLALCDIQLTLDSVTSDYIEKELVSSRK